MKALTEPGIAMSSVDMMPISAYAKAQNGNASGSLHHQENARQKKQNGGCTLPLAYALVVVILFGLATANSQATAANAGSILHAFQGQTKENVKWNHPE